MTRAKKSNRELPVGKIITLLKLHKELERAPVVSYIAQLTEDPYRILISCILSLRTKDQTTASATVRLFERAGNLNEMIRLNEKEIARLIYPVGFYNIKANKILEISRILIERYSGKVPEQMDELLALPGVGRKTANLVITEAFNKYGICVDTHVHRIVNRWGYVKTRNPHQTEEELRKKLPRKYWKELNSLLVKFGQTICYPVSPFCSRCKILHYCKKNGVTRSR
ncbi:MAG: endonuclease III [Candidatus Fischerbacteria bacterium RBG_13_37_8]|uniref:Endonuclease III n=1 Tax=Candidatus Fischerbacteria bacterium RBG_13_37_8 TaxID=1817863 RepID=A0A1F5VGI2_9BACT|nr:MAG: endonuclease III [Candidatus Fischerbacteria bacterium RBG_13_37_8]